MGLTTTASGARSFRAYCATVNVPETVHPNIFSTHIIPKEDDDESFQPKDLVESPSSDEYNQEKSSPQSVNAAQDKDFTATGPQITLMKLGPITHVILDDQEPTSFDHHDELLRWHYLLGHLPFDHIKQLAMKGQLSKHILTSKKPFCSACQYGKIQKTLEGQGRQ